LGETTISSEISSVTHTLSIQAITSSHTVSETSGSTDGVTELNGIRAVELPLVTSGGKRALLGAGKLISTPVGIENSIQTASFTSESQAVRHNGTSLGRRSGQVSAETLASETSAVDLLGREGSIVNTLGIFTVEF